MEGGFFPTDDVLESTAPSASQRGAPPARLPPPPNIKTTPKAGCAQQTEDDDFDAEGEAALDELEREEDRMLLPAVQVAASGGWADQAQDDNTATVGVCADCGDMAGDPKFFEAFGLSVCYSCQRASKGQDGGKYRMMCKTTAQKEYLLSDRQLSRTHGGLGCLLRPNPNAQGSGRPHGGDMKLYLQAQVEALALQIWGSDEALFDEKERRQDARQAKAEARKRKVADREAAARAGTNAVPSHKRPAATSRHHEQMTARVSHTHTFLADETYDEATDMWTKRCACGFEVE